MKLEQFTDQEWYWLTRLEQRKGIVLHQGRHDAMFVRCICGVPAVLLLLVGLVNGFFFLLPLAGALFSAALASGAWCARSHQVELNAFVEAHKERMRAEGFGMCDVYATGYLTLDDLSLEQRRLLGHG